MRALMPAFGIVFGLTLACGETPRGDKPTNLRADGTPVPDCKAELIALSRDIGSEPTQEQLGGVWNKVHAACGSHLRSGVLLVDRDGEPHDDFSGYPMSADEWMALRVKVCGEPSTKAAGDKSDLYSGKSIRDVMFPNEASDPNTLRYERCKLDRYGVLTKAEAKDGPPSLGLWVLHQWILDQGVPPHHARSVTRALMTIDAAERAEALRKHGPPRAVGLDDGPVWPNEDDSPAQ